MKFERHPIQKQWQIKTGCGVYHEDFGYGIVSEERNTLVSVLFESNTLEWFRPEDDRLLPISEEKRVCFREAVFFRDRKKNLAEQGIKLVVFHVLRKAAFKGMVLHLGTMCTVEEVSVKEKHTYYRLAKKGVPIGWKYEQDVENFADAPDPLGR